MRAPAPEAKQKEAGGAILRPFQFLRKKGGPSFVELEKEERIRHAIGGLCELAMSSAPSW